jgi:serine/threonine protein kinase
MYMAPEVMHHGHGGEGEGVDLNCAPPSPSKTRRGSQGYGRKTDVWSLGITIVELAKAESPFRTAAAALYSVCVKKEYPSLPSGLSTEAHAFLARCLVENPSTRASTIELLQDPFVLDSLSEERVRANSARPGSRQTTSTVSFSPIISQTKGAARSASQSSLGEFGASSRFSGWGPDSDEGGSLEVSNSSHEERSLWKTILGDTYSRAGPDALSEEKSVPSSFRSSLFQDKGDSSPDRNVK